MQFSFADYMYCYKIVKFGYSNSLLYWLCWKNIWLEPLVENELLIAEQSFISRQSLSSCLLYTLDFGFAFIEGDLHLIIYIRLFSHTLKGWKRNNSWQDLTKFSPGNVLLEQLCSKIFYFTFWRKAPIIAPRV